MQFERDIYPVEYIYALETISHFAKFGSILNALCFSAQATRRFLESRWIYLHSSILSEFARSGFPVGLTFRSLRITFLREGEKLLFPKGKSIIPVYTFFSLPSLPPLSLPPSLLVCLSVCLSLSHVYAYVICANVHSRLLQIAPNHPVARSRMEHVIGSLPIHIVVTSKKRENALIIHRIIYLLGSPIAKNSS